MLSLSCEDLLDIINDDALNTKNEEPIWEFCLRWIDFDEKNRRESVPLLLGGVRLGLLGLNVKYIIITILLIEMFNTTFWLCSSLNNECYDIITWNCVQRRNQLLTRLINLYLISTKWIGSKTQTLTFLFLFHVCHVIFCLQSVDGLKDRRVLCSKHLIYGLIVGLNLRNSMIHKDHAHIIVRLLLATKSTASVGTVGTNTTTNVLCSMSSQKHGQKWDNLKLLQGLSWKFQAEMLVLDRSNALQTMLCECLCFKW